MPGAYGFLHIYDNGPHYVYLKKDPFVIGTGPDSDLQVPVDGLEAGIRGDGICTLVLRQIEGHMRPHIVREGDMSVQLRSTYIRRGQQYALREDDIVKIPRRVEGKTVTLWLLLTYKEILPNSIHSQYHLTRILGAGGFGIVHEGMNVITGRLHAVKMVRKMRCLQSGTIKDPVQKEVEILKAQNHPYIVTLDNVFQDKRYLFLVMELVAEGSLQDLIVRQTRLSESDAKLVTLDVCSALTYLHAMSIVHRDIKPANILIQSRNPLSVKVSDFGLAKIVDGGTDLRTMCGTPDFMAPEIGPLGSYDHKVDTWALGVTLFAMLSGKSPFNGRDNDCRIQWRRLPNTSKLGTQLICRMLTVNPSYRPAASEITNHTWFVAQVGEQSQVPAQPIQTAQPPQPLQHAERASNATKKRIITTLMVVGLVFGVFGYNAWGDFVFRLVAIVAISTSAYIP